MEEERGRKEWRKEGGRDERKRGMQGRGTEEGRKKGGSEGRRNGRGKGEKGTEERRREGRKEEGNTGRGDRERKEGMEGKREGELTNRRERKKNIMSKPTKKENN